jgi:hypothetical protein
MRYINKITDAAQQQIYLTGNPGQRISLYMRYLPSQQFWLMDVEYNDFTVKGILVVTSPNLLRAFKNIIPFGIACTTVNGLDPYYSDDFALQRSSLYLLTEAEVEQMEEDTFS